MARRSAWCVLMLVVAGCAELDTAPTRPCTRTEVAQRFQDVGATQALDLLIVTDGATDLDTWWSDGLGDAVGAILAGDLERDGEPDFMRVESLQLAIVSADPSAEPAELIRCAEELAIDAPGFGCRGASWAETDRQRRFFGPGAALAVVVTTPAVDDAALEEALRARRAPMAYAVGADRRGALEDVLGQIARSRCPFGCYPRPLRADQSGRVECDIYELLPASGPASRCEGLPGRERVSVLAAEGDGEGPRELCRVTQLDRASVERGGVAGWYYDDFSAKRVTLCGERSQRFVYAAGSAVSAGAEQRIECVREQSTSGARVDPWCDGLGEESCEVGMLCEPDADHCPTGSARVQGEQVPLRCDLVDRVCAVPCERDADCSAAAPGQICDRRSNAASLGPYRSADLSVELRGAQRGVCVHPSCG